MTSQRAGRPQDPEDFYADHEAHNRKVLAEADFPVYGVERGVEPEEPAREESSAPPNASAAVDGSAEALAEYEVLNGRLGWVELRSGDWSSIEGPYVTVRTYRPGAERSRPLPELDDVVEDERDRVYEQLDVDEGDGPGRVRALREWITVEGEPRSVQIHEDRRPDEESRPVWAGRLRVDGVTVTVTGRGVSPDGIELKRIEDFDKYITGRTELMRQLSLRQRARNVPIEERTLPPASGLEAHRELVEYSLSEAIALEAQLGPGDTPRMPRRLQGEAKALRWESAVRQQMRLASETRDEATESVSMMVNHVTRLAQQTDWLTSTPAGSAALEEVVRYTAFASEVPSLPAQRAWERLWAETPSGTEEQWLTAWEQWRVERTHR